MGRAAHWHKSLLPQGHAVLLYQVANGALSQAPDLTQIPVLQNTRWMSANSDLGTSGGFPCLLHGAGSRGCAQALPCSDGCVPEPLAACACCLSEPTAPSCSRRLCQVAEEL